MYKPNPPLSDDEIALLLRTPYHDLVETFPRHSRRWLVERKRQAKANRADDDTPRRVIRKRAQTADATPTPTTSGDVVLAIPDLHIPFHHPDALAFLRAVHDAHRCTRVVCLGDEVDFHALGNWEHDPDGYSAGHELAKALDVLPAFYEAFPRVDVCTSNHTSRPLRKAFSAGIPKAFVREYREFLSAPESWQWAESHVIDGVHYTHGGSGSSWAGVRRQALELGASIVCGHRHNMGGVIEIPSAAQRLYACQAGTLIDLSGYAFRYHSGPLGVALGCAVVDRGVPRYVPMRLDARGRWEGAI